MKKIWYLFVFLWHLVQRLRIHNSYVRSVRKGVFRSIAYAYSKDENYVAFREKVEFDMALDIMSTLGIFKSWRHDGVFYIIYIDKGDEKTVHEAGASEGA